MALSAVNATGSVVWWGRHGVRWVVSDRLWVFPGPWEWAAVILVLAAVSGAFLAWGWRNASRGVGDDTKVFGGMFLTLASLLPLGIQLMRYAVLVVVVGAVIAFCSKPRFGR